MCGAGVLVPVFARYKGVSRCFWGEEPAGKANIILIMVDDMGFSDIGCYGGEIDTWAKGCHMEVWGSRTKKKDNLVGVNRQGY